MNTLYVQGVGFWSAQMPGWDIAAPVLRGDAPIPETRARRPAPARLAPAERRRAPDTVCLALQVADEAVGASGLDGAGLPCVFASTNGDLPLTDYMCETVAGDATLLSPTRFHNSVHNAPAGYWTMASGCQRPSTAVAAYNATFGAGLLEAFVQVASMGEPLLYVAYDVGATGTLASINSSRGLLATALVLSPSPAARSMAVLHWQTGAGARQRPAGLPAPCPPELADNALADCLPLFRALANGTPADLDVAAGRQLFLQLSVRIDS